MTALVDVALNVSVTLDHIKRQYDAERSKAKGKQASDRLENLLEKQKEVRLCSNSIVKMYVAYFVCIHKSQLSHNLLRP